MAATTTLTAKQVATKLGTEPRTFRKFLRQMGQGVGRGTQYTIESSELPTLRKAFKAWEKALEADKAAKAEQAEMAALTNDEEAAD